MILANEGRSHIHAAAILCGGESRRMGVDKASLVNGATSLIERQVEELRAMFPELRIFICSGSRDYPELEAYSVDYIHDTLESAGPLSGLGQALSTVAMDDEDAGSLFVIPIDSLILPTQILKVLTSSQSAASITLLTSQRLHPLHGLFSAQLGRDMVQYVASGGRSVMDFVKAHTWQVAVAPDDWEPCLNFNSPEEYQEAIVALPALTVL